MSTQNRHRLAAGPGADPGVGLPTSAPPAGWKRRAAAGALLPLLLAAVAAAAPQRPAAPPRAAAPPVDFNRDVRPILAENCFACHGMDANTRMMGLRLDTDDALKPLPSGRTAIVPGKPEASALYQRITAEGAAMMPPPSTGKTLTAAQIETLRRWIAQGGQYDIHWAYVPPRRHPLPAVKNTGWPRGAIDRFILARLEREGLQPSPEADRPTLIRRLSLDLLGLPPTPREVEAFLQDRRPDAYERLVDRLLASPHYGERMAQYWLDLVRYADTVGYHGDQEVTVWPYRDYVIRAFNSNKRFDQFTREQLAGDLFTDDVGAGTPPATRAGVARSRTSSTTPDIDLAQGDTAWASAVERLVASGYNRLGMMSAEGGVQDKEYRAKYAAERVRTASVVWMGQTLGCAECHDHKFDPFTANDFYRFAAFFADLNEKGFYDGGFGRGDWGPSLKLPSEAQKARLDALEARIQDASQALAALSDDALAEGRARWEAEIKARDAAKTLAWTPLPPIEARSTEGSILEIERDDRESEAKNTLFVSGPLPKRDTYIVTLPAPMERITAIRLQALGDERLPGNGIARSGHHFVLSGFEVEVQRGSEPPRPVRLIGVKTGRKDGVFPGLAAIDGRPETGWGEEHSGPGVAVFIPEEPVQGGPDTKLIVRLRHEAKPYLAIGKFRLSITDLEGADISAQGVPDGVLAALRKAPVERSAEERERIAAHYRTLAPETSEPRARLDQLEAERRLLLGEIPHTLISEAVEPRVIRVLPRGDWMDDSGEIVQPGVPGAFRQIRKEGRATRLDLAEWIVAPDNPLTARVFTNRLWKLFYGVGLAKNLDDFGKQGEAPPVHPELLDWLAREFVSSGWDVKHMVRLMVTSRTYRQSSKARSDLFERDSYNRLHARQMPVRLDAEFVRDVALRASGLLSERIGGRSVRPYQPRGYLAPLNFPRREWAEDEGENLYRRGLYTHWQRTFLHPSLLAFDASTREECSASRVVSNTPMQALVLLNDPIFVEASRAFGERIMREGGQTLEERLQFAYRCALSRDPEAGEIAVLRRLYHTRRARYSADREAAEALIRVGDAPMPNDLDAAELAAWASVARAILNLHETITRG